MLNVHFFSMLFEFDYWLYWFWTWMLKPIWACFANLYLKICHFIVMVPAELATRQFDRNGFGLANHSSLWHSVHVLSSCFRSHSASFSRWNTVSWYLLFSFSFRLNLRPLIFTFWLEYELLARSQSLVACCQNCLGNVKLGLIGKTNSYKKLVP